MDAMAPTPRHNKALLSATLIAATVLLLLSDSVSLDFNKSQTEVAPRGLKVAEKDGCPCVLISSPGGVASTSFLLRLDRSEKEGQSTLCYNNYDDVDLFKHKPATFWKHDSSGLYHGDKCFHKALIIVGDPLHTIESTCRRFKTTHLNKHRENAGLPKYERNATLFHIYQDIAETKEDTTGVSHYLESWFEASQDSEHWPEINVVTSQTLFSNAEQFARWLGITQEGLHHFSRLRYHPSTVHTDAPYEVREVFEPIQEYIFNLQGMFNLEGMKVKENIANE